MAIKQAGQQEQDGRYSAGYELWVSTEWIAAMELTEREREREREREIGGEGVGTIKREPSVCRRLQGLQDYI
jgi:hypothetical protein